MASHTPADVWHTFVCTLDGHNGLAALHEVVASHTPADVWQMFVSVFGGQFTLAELHDSVASHAPADVWHCVVDGRYAPVHTVVAEPSGLQVTTPVVPHGPVPAVHAAPVGRHTPSQLDVPAAQLPTCSV